MTDKDDLMQEASAEYLADVGINADSPFNSERRIGDPVRVRIGDDLVTRRGHDGGMEICIGYFTKLQTDARKLWARQVAESVKPFTFARFLEAHNPE